MRSRHRGDLVLQGDYSEVSALMPLPVPGGWRCALCGRPPGPWLVEHLLSGHTIAKGGGRTPEGLVRR